MSPAWNTIVSGPEPGSQSPLVVSESVLALSSASRSVHRPSPAGLVSDRELTVMVAAAAGPAARRSPMARTPWASLPRSRSALWAARSRARLS